MHGEKPFLPREVLIGTPESEVMSATSGERCA